MHTFIKNYKNLLLLSLRNEFAQTSVLWVDTWDTVIKSEEIWEYISFEWSSRAILLTKMETLSKEITGKEQETYFLVELEDSEKHHAKSIKFAEYPTKIQINKAKKELLLKYGNNEKAIEHEKEVFKEFWLSEEVRKDLHAHGLDYEMTKKHGLLRLDRKWIGDNEINIEIVKDKYNIHDDHGKVNFKNISKDKVEDIVFEIDRFLRLMEQSEIKVNVINESFENTFILSRVASKDKKLRSTYNSINAWRAISTEKKIKSCIEKLELYLDIWEQQHREAVKKALANLKPWSWHVEMPQATPGDYDWMTFEGKFLIEWGTIHLDTTWSQPGTDKYFMVPYEDLEEDGSLSEEKFEEYKQNLRRQYYNEVYEAKEDWEEW